MWCVKVQIQSLTDGQEVEGGCVHWASTEVAITSELRCVVHSNDVRWVQSEVMSHAKPRYRNTNEAGSRSEPEQISCIGIGLGSFIGTL